MLLFLSQRQDCLVHLQRTLSKGKVTLPDQLLTPLVVAVDVQIFLGDDVDYILQSILIYANRCRIKAVDLQHLTLRILELEYIHCVIFSV